MQTEQGDLFSLPKPEPRRAFDGATYTVERDYLRLDCQLGRVFALMKDGKWRTLPNIAAHVEGGEAALSARLRDFRKAKYGGHLVERRHLQGGLYEYRLTVC
jgi:hypothetical protein